jgi:hypothetical protein
MQYESRPSWSVLVTLSLFWIGLLAWSLVVAADLWPRDPDALVIAQVTAARSVWEGLGEGMRTAAPRIHLVLVATLSAPLMALTWLALPPRDRGTFPVILTLWVVGVIAAYSEWLPTTDAVVFALACVPVLAVAEVLRSVLTAMVRQGTRAVQSREASV